MEDFVYLFQFTPLREGRLQNMLKTRLSIRHYPQHFLLFWSQTEEIFKSTNVILKYRGNIAVFCANLPCFDV